jgi:hypothetical protein
VIARWWAANPGANVGIRTGSSTGLLVLDFDGAPGAESFKALRDRHGSFAAAWVRSGSGGWHAYLAHPRDRQVPSSAGRVGPGVDVRADGGSIVAPPSRHASGRRYQWTYARGDLPAAPDWMIALALPPPLPAPQPVSAIVRHVAGDYAAAAVRGEAAAVESAPVGQRNHRLNLAAWRLGRLAAAGILDETPATDALLAAASAAGLPMHESLGTVRSGMRAGRRSPRALVISSADDLSPHRAPAGPRAGRGGVAR